jgi:archaellum component FlaF (FlaF/FlaG flagellin family)
MKAISPIISAMFSFLIFLLSIAILMWYINTTTNALYEKAYIIAKKAHEKALENIKFLNNETSFTNPYISIKNIGSTILDLKCFKLFINGKLTEFNYTKEILFPNEISNITFENTYLKNNSWNTINLISCNGLRYIYTIYAK